MAADLVLRSIAALVMVLQDAGVKSDDLKKALLACAEHEELLRLYDRVYPDQLDYFPTGGRYDRA